MRVMTILALSQAIIAADYSVRILMGMGSVTWHSVLIALLFAAAFAACALIFGLRRQRG